MRTLRKVGSHDKHLTAAFSGLCRQEALKTIHLQLARAKGSLPRVQRTHHTFQARLADVRAEMLADLCTIPEARSDAERPVLSSQAAHGERAAAGWCGVNLSGWLLWEPGPADGSALVASLGEDDPPKDEWTLCERLVASHGRARAEQLVHEFRRERVTRADFAAIRSLGFNAVRVPFGYWAFSAKANEPFVGNCTEFLDAALDWGVEFGLSVVLCFHAAVGFQSTEPPCGRANEKWRPSHFDVVASVDIMRQVAKRYGQHPGLGGLCILNEPSGEIPACKMNRYFQDTYSALRDECSLPASVQIMLPVFHHDFKHFKGTYTEEKGYVNVVFDVHCYQIFGDPYAGWSKMSLAQHLRWGDASASEHDARRIAGHGERVVVSEFSLALPNWDQKVMISREYSALSKSEKSQLFRCFALRQLRSFAKYTEGFFFWSWKDDAGPEWCLQESCAKMWMPSFSHENIVKQKAVQHEETSQMMPSLKRRRLMDASGPDALQASHFERIATTIEGHAGLLVANLNPSGASVEEGNPSSLSSPMSSEKVKRKLRECLSDASTTCSETNSDSDEQTE
jgi:glucan 1,3-beta-glucosidase